MGDPLEYTPGSSVPDTALFRAAGLRLVAAVRDKEIPLSSFNFSVEENALPRAVMSVPIGTPAEEGGEVFGTAVLDTLFKRFTSVTVRLYVTSPVTGAVESLLAPGRYTIFKGIVESRQAESSTQGAQLNVTLQHTMVQLLAGTSLFSPFMPNDLQDVQVIFKGMHVSDSMPDISLKDDLWKTVSEAVTNLLSSAVQREDLFRDIIEEEDIKTYSDQAIALVEKMKSLLHLTLEKKYIEGQVTAELFHRALASLSSRPNIWALLVDIAQSFSATLVPVLGNVCVLPVHAFGPTESYKVAPAGTFIAKADSDGIESPDFTSVSGVLVVGDSPGYHISPHGKPSALPSFFLDLGEEQQPYAVTLVQRLPAWLLPDTNRIDSKNALGVTSTSLRLPRSCMTPLRPEVAEGFPSLEEVDDTIREFLSVPSRQYARDITLSQLFGVRQVTITTALRFDVIPGQNMRLDFAGQEPVYGRVARVSYNVDSASVAAYTTITISLVRGQSDQDEFVAQGATDHYCWEDRTREISALRWTEVENAT